MTTTVNHSAHIDDYCDQTVLSLTFTLMDRVGAYSLLKTKKQLREWWAKNAKTTSRGFITDLEGRVLLLWYRNWGKLKVEKINDEVKLF